MVLNLIFRVLEGGSVKKERKYDLLMHISISVMFSLFLFYYHFLSFLFFYSLFFFLSSPLGSSFSLIQATSLLFILLNCMGFLHFVPKASPIVFVFLWTSLQDYPLNHQLPDHYLYPKHACCTTPHFMTKFLILFLLFPHSVLLEWIRIEGSPSTYPYGMHRVVPTLCLHLWGKMPSQQGIFPKRCKQRVGTTRCMPQGQVEGEPSILIHSSKTE